MTETLSEKFLEAQKRMTYEKLRDGKFIFLSDVLETLEGERKKWIAKKLEEEERA